MRKRLTDRTLDALKATGKRYDVWDETLGGFGVRISERGKRQFILFARFGGAPNPTRRAIGEYPKVSLAQARNTARAWQAMLAQGVDPATEIARHQREEARRNAASFGVVVGAYLEHLRKRRYRSLRDVENCLNREFVSRWGDRPISDIERRDVLAVLDDLVSEGKLHAARNALAYLRSLFNWACDRYDLPHSPCERIKPRHAIGTTSHRTRVLSDDELRALWAACGDLGYPFGQLFRFMLLTGQRRDECSQASWREFDLKHQTWTIPAARYKSGTPHIVPLTDDMIALLQGLPRFKGGDYVFSTTLGKRPVSGFSKAKARLDAMMSTEPFVLHDCRRSMRTALASLRVPDAIAELAIGHSKKGLIKVYNQHSYIDELRDAFSRWNIHLRGIVAPVDNVVELRAW
jgi:integrase